MDNLQKYKPTDKMIDLISDNYSLLQVMSRFGLSLGFGDKTVKEVCELNGVDCRTFLIVVNFIAEGFSRLDGDDGEISIPGLIDYLRQAHIYFLDFSLPAIRRKLIEAIDCSQDDVAFLLKGRQAYNMRRNDIINRRKVSRKTGQGKSQLCTERCASDCRNRRR